MTARNRQITELLKQGLTVPEVAQALDYPVEMIEAVLVQDAEVRHEVASCSNNKLEHEFEAMEDLATRTIKQIMECGDKDSVRLAAATYVTDQRLGLKVPKTTVNVFNTVVDLNARLEQVRARKRELEAACVEVESSIEKVAV